MPNVYQAGLVQIRAQYQLDPDSANTPENVLWFQSGTTSTPSLAQLQAMQNIFDAQWAAFWRTMAASNHQYMGSVVTDWGSNTGLQWNSVGTFTPVAGQGSGAPLSPQVACLVSYHVPIRYRGGHPRSYLPSVSTSVVDSVRSDTISTSTTSTMATQLNTLISDMKSSGVLGGQTMVVYLHKNITAKAQVMQFPSFTVNGLVATQRRRVRHVGRK